jgi:hypothetical protein
MDCSSVGLRRISGWAGLDDERSCWQGLWIVQRAATTKLFFSLWQPTRQISLLLCIDKAQKLRHGLAIRTNESEILAYTTYFTLQLSCFFFGLRLSIKKPDLFDLH